jgi:hypothetical protein
MNRKMTNKEMKRKNNHKKKTMNTTTARPPLRALPSPQSSPRQKQKESQLMSKNTMNALNTQLTFLVA